MGKKDNRKLVDFEKMVFSVADEQMPKGAWWWWFWLFFFDNPEDPKNPRQLMILWSTRKVKKTSINGMDVVFDHPQPKNKLDIVAAWYFDGEKMNHNWLLEQCDINISEKALVSKSKVPTEFTVEGNSSKVMIGKDMEFVIDHSPVDEAAKPTRSDSTLFLNWGYSIIRLPRGKLKAIIDGETSNGTAYFQRVFVNSPGVVPWYWGIFHFHQGHTLQYFIPYFLKKPLKKDISFFDGENTHKFKDISIERQEGDLPKFKLKGKSGKKKIRFTVEPYSHSSWTFVSTPLGLTDTELVYNEYPAKISDLVFEDGNGTKITSKDLGTAIGNAEHTTGFLL